VSPPNAPFSSINAMQYVPGMRGVPSSTGGEGDSYIQRGVYNNIAASGSSPVASGDTFVYFRLNRGEYALIRKTAPPPNMSSPIVLTHLVAGVGLDGNYTGGNTAVIGEYQYGWDGNAWVLGSNGAATTSNTTTMLENGISVTFQGGGAPSQSFVTGDYFNFAVCNGILKDDVSTINFTTTSYVKTVLYNQAVGNVVIPANTAAITTATVQTAYSDISSNVTVNSSNQVVLTGLPGDYAVMDYPFTGNFDVTINFTSLATQPIGAKFGLGIGKQIMYGFSLDTAGVEYGWYRHWDQGYEGQQQSGSAYLNNGSPLTTQYTPIQTVRFTRTGYGSATVTIAMYINGNLWHSETDAQYTQWNVYQLIFRTYLPIGSPITMGTVTINSADANPPMIKLGAVSTKTGSYDPYFFGLDTVTPNMYNGITINGTPAAFAHSWFSTLPNPGEVSVDQSGFVAFSAADVGKTASGTYMYLQDSGII
jgi:hypothetical protein